VRTNVREHECVKRIERREKSCNRSLRELSRVDVILLLHVFIVFVLYL
jgi:hypothetical protein